MTQITTFNPFNGEVLNTYPTANLEEAFSLIAQSKNAQLEWQKKSVAERVSFFTNLGNVLSEHIPQFAELCSLEMGKPKTEAEYELQKCIRLFDWYQQNAPELLKIVDRSTSDFNAVSVPTPLGVCLGIMPWNYPFWQALRFAIPAIAAGNSVILKHAPSVTGCAVELEKVFELAGFPKGLFSVLVADNDTIASVIQHPAVRSVSFTGSNQSGWIVAQLAGASGKKSVLELGGSDPFIVFEDANVEAAAAAAIRSRFINAGQSCISAKRFIVHQSVAERFTQLISSGIHSLKIGNPLDPQTDIGPLARIDLAEKVKRQIDESVAMGAKILVGGNRIEPGYFVEPTLLIDITRNMPVWKEEIFGPVASLITFDSTEEAIDLANDTEFGLGASVWTENRNLGTIVASQIETGNVYINDMVKSDPALPFGGVKSSGYGKELSKEGLFEFVNFKTVLTR